MVYQMKRIQSFKGFVCGFLAAIVLLISLPVLAASVDVIFNPLNIVINGVKAGNKGENYTLSNGSEVPFSIVYKGTTYLPLRKLAELVGKDIVLDSATDTVHLNDPVITYDPKEEFPEKEGKVMPENAVTKKELARWLVQSLKLTENAYTGEIVDVSVDDEYYNDITLAVGNGFMKLQASKSLNLTDTFYPNEPVNRLEFAIMVYYEVWKNPIKHVEPPYDIPDIYTSLSTMQCVYGVIDIGLLELYPDGTFRPYEPLAMDLTPNPDLKNYIQE